MSFSSAVIEYKWIILFYLGIVLLIYVFRKKFEFQSKFIAMYKTKVGLKLMDNIGVKHKEFVKILGYVGIGAGYIGMVVILGFIVKGVYDLMFVPGAPPVLAPVLPGVPIPGSPIFVPFWYGITALFIVVAIHEFSHGVVARAHNIPVKSSGVVFFGPLIGAFVEPDEEKIKKEKDVVKYSIFAAGPFSNILLSAFILLITFLFVVPLTNHLAQPNGFEVITVEEGMPAKLAGLEPGVVYTKVNGVDVLSTEELEKVFEEIKPGDTVVIGNNAKEYSITTTARAESPEQAVVGINLKTRYTNDETWWLKVILWFNGLLSWIFILSLGLGLANLLPLGPVDGGRMILESLQKTMGEDKGKVAWVRITIAMLIIIVVLVFVPMGKAIF